jgi:hypothetical protein
MMDSSPRASCRGAWCACSKVVRRAPRKQLWPHPWVSTHLNKPNTAFEQGRFRENGRGATDRAPKPNGPLPWRSYHKLPMKPQRRQQNYTT